MLLFGLPALVQVSALTDKLSVIALAADLRVYAAIYVFIAVWAFQLDRLFIGVGYGQALRNCSFVATSAYLLLWKYLFSAYSLDGLWFAFISIVILRGLCLACYWPALLRRVLKSQT